MTSNPRNLSAEAGHSPVGGCRIQLHIKDRQLDSFFFPVPILLFFVSVNLSSAPSWPISDQ
jgi:hypothetical protein